MAETDRIHAAMTTIVEEALTMLRMDINEHAMRDPLELAQEITDGLSADLGVMIGVTLRCYVYEQRTKRNRTANP